MLAQYSFQAVWPLNYWLSNPNLKGKNNLAYLKTTLNTHSAGQGEKLKNIKEKVLYFLDVRSASVHNMTQVFEWYSPICTTASLPRGGVQSYVLRKEDNHG